MSKTTNKFSPGLRARAARMILDHEGDYPSRWSAVVSVADKIGDIVSGGQIRTRAIVMQQKTGDQFSSNCCRTPGPVCWHGLNAGVALWTTTSSRAGSITVGISAPASMLGVSMNGAPQLA